MKTGYWLIPVACFALWSLQAQQVITLPPSHLDNNCTLVATAAASYIAKTGSWVKIVHINFIDEAGYRQHSVTVWQPLTSNGILMYDQYLCRGGATIELPTESREVKDICNALMSKFKIVMISAYYLK